MTNRLAWGAMAVAGLLAGCSGGGGDAAAPVACVRSASTSTVASAAQAESLQVRSGSVSALQARSAAQPTATRIVLGDVAQARVAAVQPVLNQVGVPLRVGLPRDVAQTTTVTATAAALQWQATASGGKVAAISIDSGLARGVRLGLLVRSLPAQATLRVYAQGSANAYEIRAQEVLDALKLNAAAGDSSDAARTYWAPLVEGSEATLEIELPASVSTDSVQIAIPRVSHWFGNLPTDAPGQASSTTNTAKALSGSCEVDVSCNTNYSTESNSVARMSFVDPDGSGFLCTGTLVNDVNGSGTPYFLSANHCISQQSQATSLQTWWFYRAASCSSTTVNAGATVLTGGATLLYASSSSDTSFMQLLRTPPTGAVFAGWTTATTSPGATVATLHHPEGDVQKISTGAVNSFQSCTAINASTGTFSCSPSTQAAGNFVDARFSSGATEAGSSGAPLFETVGSNHFLKGQLFGGSSSCTNRGASDIYGRFDVAYNAALKTWLGQAASTSTSAPTTAPAPAPAPACQ